MRTRFCVKSADVSHQEDPTRAARGERVQLTGTPLTASPPPPSPPPWALLPGWRPRPASGPHRQRPLLRPVGQLSAWRPPFSGRAFPERNVYNQASAHPCTARPTHTAPRTARLPGLPCSAETRRRAFKPVKEDLPTRHVQMGPLGRETKLGKKKPSEFES